MSHRDHPVTAYVTVVGETGQLIDVREPREVAGGTLHGAVNIPLGELPKRLEELDPDGRVVLLCRSGGRSTKAAKFLSSKGFTDVVNLEGGMLAYEDHRQAPDQLHPARNDVVDTKITDQRPARFKDLRRFWK